MKVNEHNGKNTQNCQLEKVEVSVEVEVGVEVGVGGFTRNTAAVEIFMQPVH